MCKIDKNQNGFTVVEFLIVLLAIIIIGAAGYFITKHDDNSKNSTSGNTASVVASKVTYAQCQQASGHSAGVPISYTYGSAQNLKYGSVSTCFMPDGTEATDTTSTNVTSEKISVDVKYSSIADSSLKKAILTTDEFSTAGCETNGSLADSSVIVSAYIPGYFAAATPVDCYGAGSLNQVVYAYANGSWKIIYDQQDTPSKLDITCDTVNQYKVPVLFIVNAFGNDNCANFNKSTHDLISGLNYSA